MRQLLTTLGTAIIVGYALCGAATMNDWALDAASGLPLQATIDAMTAAGQPYSAVPGDLFAAVGIALAAGWFAVNVYPRLGVPLSVSLPIWAGILALGGPAYFLASFGNLMSVGDTFYEWNADAVAALENPLYLISAVAAALTVAALIRSLARCARPRLGAAVPTSGDGA